MPDLEEIQIFLKAEWEAISGAPFLFLTALIGISILIWLVLRFFCKQQIRGLENENRAKDETIRALKERVSLAKERFKASDEARKDLETKLNSDVSTNVRILENWLRSLDPPINTLAGIWVNDENTTEDALREAIRSLNIPE